ncbi:MAG: polymer-forming cytoskeletal protein [Salinivirgaceae bacterium]|nr:polymer-forming cytoskeletal protein [Salinivirgaceae bacterium]MDD4746420.1 polymer-forming cytoskeletal protein [Salinivirgaceae bacterium]MDY0279699.1 polymer-forming cytoskeletal protein [Salinivirgaceae bacterium]
METKQTTSIMAKSTITDPNSINIICEGTSITGDIITDGEIRIDGTLTGILQAKGKVVIGVTGKLSGELSCKNADIQGKVDGKITVLELLTFKKTCVFKGDLSTKQLAIEPGATFNGTCQMSSTAPSTSDMKK